MTPSEYEWQCELAETELRGLMREHPDKVTQARERPQLIGWFVGQVMKATGGKANPAQLNDLLSKIQKTSAETEKALANVKLLDAQAVGERHAGVRYAEKRFDHPGKQRGIVDCQVHVLAIVRGRRGEGADRPKCCREAPANARHRHAYKYGMHRIRKR